MERPRDHYVLTEAEFQQVVREAVFRLNPKIIEEEPYDEWAGDELAARFLTHGTRLDRALESLETGKAGGRPSKVDYWAEQDDVIIDDVTYDLPWPDEDHEMAIKSTRTVSRLKDRLEESDDQPSERAEFSGCEHGDLKRLRGRCCGEDDQPSERAEFSGCEHGDLTEAQVEARLEYADERMSKVDRWHDRIVHGDTSLEDIDVGKVSEGADVSRPTFYEIRDSVEESTED